MPFGTRAEDFEDGGPIRTVEEFLIASTEGDVDAIKALIGGPYYERRKALLNANQEYSSFLREYSKRGYMRIAEVRKEDGKNSAVVTLENRLKEGQIITTNLVLSKNQSGEWKIVDEIFE
jgi:hypothetical protein